MGKYQQKSARSFVHNILIICSQELAKHFCIPPVFDEREIEIRLGSSGGHPEIILLEQDFPECKDCQTLFLSHVIKWCVTEKSALNLSEPTRNLSLVFAIGLAKVLLQDALFLWYCVIIEEHVPNHEGDHESDTPIENYPSKQEDQFGNIHRVARITVKPIREQIRLVQFEIYSHGGLS